jgi:two-component system sensor histidine kinase KdpD
VDITARVSEGSTEIRVSDNGPGLPAGCELRVFDRFFRGSVSPPDGRRGVGLGLAICLAIVQAHGGEISAANRPTGGAEFLVKLPSDRPPPTIDAVTQAEEAIV